MARKSPQGRATPRKGSKPVVRGQKAQKAMARKRPPKPMSKAGGKRAAGRTSTRKASPVARRRTAAAKNPKSRSHPNKTRTKSGGKVSGGHAAPKAKKSVQKASSKQRMPASRSRAGLYGKGPTKTARGRPTGRQKVRNTGFGNTRATKNIKARNGGRRSYPAARSTPRIKRYGLTHSTMPNSAWKSGGITSSSGARVKLNTVW